LIGIIHFGLLRFLVFERTKYTEEDLFFLPPQIRMLMPC
jgi:hypothetical protein